MLRVLLPLVLTLSLAAPVPVAAQDEGGRSLMERGAELFFRGLMSEMEPALRDLGEMAEEVGPALRSFVREMGPALSDLMKEIKDFSAYHPPEILPNGDIIMRRKEPLPPDATPETVEPGTEIEI
ncbi:hypothetical protein [Oceanicola sp. 22II-s10i]|uniref:hypothetical protein n=1 Tax=Oceanicola sp. 22II-s10i TaxID=1317116 RepID=UPI000B526E0B|nr:hypothetical protein [Oceanicola sp. 22II-s10i]